MYPVWYVNAKLKTCVMIWGRKKKLHWCPQGTTSVLSYILSTSVVQGAHIVDVYCHSTNQHNLEEYWSPQGHSTGICRNGTHQPLRPQSRSFRFRLTPFASLVPDITLQ